jgi:hypothetical protein
MPQTSIRIGQAIACHIRVPSAPCLDSCDSQRHVTSTPRSSSKHMQAHQSIISSYMPSKHAPDMPLLVTCTRKHMQAAAQPTPVKAPYVPAMQAVHAEVPANRYRAAHQTPSLTQEPTKAVLPTLVLWSSPLQSRAHDHAVTLTPSHAIIPVPTDL